MRIFRKTNINFLGIRKYMYAISALLILTGLVSLIVKGLPYGIDFSGGTELLVDFHRDISIGEVRSALDKVGLGRSEIKSFGTAGSLLIRLGEEESAAAQTPAGERIKQALTTGLPNTNFEVLRESKIGPKVGKELRRDATYAVIASLLAILGYIGIRFKWIYGIGAVVALFHDVLFTLGMMSLLDGIIPGYNFEITQEVIAAFLTLVGVSVNDTVVVFDRIRENLKLFRSLSLEEVMRKSLNDTLSRTIITSGTIFLVLAILLVFGGEVNRNFALTLTIGIIVGTYSSIYIASAVVLDWSQKLRSRSAQKAAVKVS